jgi:hypothetical protein
VRWTLTPLLGLSHVYYELTDDQGEPRKDDEVWVVTGDIDHNPHISERGKRKFLKRFKNDPLKLQARKSGRWVHFAGRIYDEFEETDVDEDGERGHLCPPRPIPREHEGAKPSVPVFEWIDPGIATDHPAAFGAAWLNPDDTLEIFHTFKLIGGTAGDMADHIKETRQRFGYKPRGPVVIDPSARNKHHQTGRSTQDEYRKHGIYTKPGPERRRGRHQRDEGALQDAPDPCCSATATSTPARARSPRPTSPRSGATTAGRATSARAPRTRPSRSRSRRRTTSPTAAATW